MRIKTQFNFQNAEHQANSVVIYDDQNNPIFAATEIFGDTIIGAQADDADFAHVLKLIGNDTPPKIITLSPKAK